MTYFIIGIVVFLLLSIVGRIYAERNLKWLTDEQKGMLVRVFSKTRVVTTVLLGVIILGFLAMVYFKSFDPEKATYLYFGVILLFYVVTGFYGHFQLAKLDIPPAYRKANLQLVILRIVGMAVFLYCILQGMLPTLSGNETAPIQL